MENYREIIKDKLNEARMNPQSVAKSIGDTVNVVKSTLGADDKEAKDIVKGFFTVKEGETKENNPWAICTASVGRDDKEKYEACVMDVKKKLNMENITEEEHGKLRSVKVTYSNGETQGVSMAAHLTDDEILNYFKIGKVFNLGKNGVEDNLQKVTKVEILDKTPMTTESVRPRMTKSEFEKVIKESSDTYFKTFSGAVQYAREMAEKKGYEINSDSWATVVNFGAGKPSVGKTTRMSVELKKDGKDSKKQLHMQVYGMDNSYELNYYIN